MAKRGLLGRKKHSDTQPAADDYRLRAADLTVGDYANGMPHIRIGEMFKSFGRQLWWLLPLLLMGTAAAWYATKDFKRTYSGEGRILVQLGPEYIYESVTSEAGGNGLLLTPDHIVLNEIGLMKNPEIIDQVISEMQLDPQLKQRFAREAFEKLGRANSPAERANAWMELRTKVENSYHVAAKPKSSIVDLAFKHEDGEIAVLTLNALIQTYMDDRSRVFVAGTADELAESRRETEGQLAENERKIQRFLAKTNVSDFESERGGVQKRTEELRAALNKLRGEMAETEAGLATVENQLRSVPAEINLYVDDRASQRVAQAELELKQLLAKYLPSSKPVQQKQTEIAELRSLQASNNGNAIGGRRVGPNTVYQALLTRRNMLQSTADSYREKEYTLQQQLNSADAKVRRLQSGFPEYQNLLRERDTVAARLKSYAAKEQEALVNQAQSSKNNENIQVIHKAKYAKKGRNMRIIAFALATLGWGFTLFMLAMLRVFLDPRLYANPGPRSRMAARMPHSEIPEPVAPYAPDYEPMIAPAAASAYASQTSGYDETDFNAEVYGGTQSMSGGAGSEGYAAQTVMAQDYTDGYDNTGAAEQVGNLATAYDLYDNPYLSGAQAGTLEAQAENRPDQTAMHNQDGMPVLGVIPPHDQG